MWVQQMIKVSNLLACMVTKIYTLELTCLCIFVSVEYPYLVYFTTACKVEAIVLF